MKRSMIWVVTHKEFDTSIVPKTGYRTIVVGKKGNHDGFSNEYMFDDTGINMSYENPYYCELTAQYWAWQHANEFNVDYMGLVHYRRYFVDYSKNNEKVADNILLQEDISRILSKYKIILPLKGIKNPGKAVYYKQYAPEKQDKHWDLLYQIIKERFPEYEAAFTKYVTGESYCACNMFISTKEVFCEYSKWLFEVLKQYDLKISANNEERLARVDGYLSESLINVWLLHNISRDEIYYEATTLITDKNKKSNRLRRLFGINHNVQLLSQNVMNLIKYTKNLPAYLKYKNSIK